MTTKMLKINHSKFAKVITKIGMSPWDLVLMILSIQATFSMFAET